MFVPRREQRGFSIAVWMVCLLAVSCGSGAPEPPDTSKTTPERVGLTPAEQAEFYHLEEGSEVFPFDWFMALEREDGGGLFAENLERFGFLPDPASTYRMPIGITVADTRDLRFAGVKMVGVNCAACHVTELRYQGRTIRLDGAGARTDTTAFYSALATAVRLTTTDVRRFLRFVKRLRARAPSFLLDPAESSRSVAVFGALPIDGAPSSSFDAGLQASLRARLEQELSRAPIDLSEGLTLTEGPELAAAERAIDARLMNDLTPEVLSSMMPGRSRGRAGSAIAGVAPPDAVDAFASSFLKDSIVNLRLLLARARFIFKLVNSMEGETTPPRFGRLDAFGGARNLLFNPASQPSPTVAPVSYPHLWNFERLKWVHWDANTTSVLERNLGQALGLGAIYDARTSASTVSVRNLHRLEQLAKKIAPPRWASIFGASDEEAARRGRTTFEAECANCHSSIDESGTAGVVDVGSDPNRALHFAEPVGNEPNSVAIDALLKAIKRRAYADARISPSEQEEIEGHRPAIWRETKLYAKRPLIAIWATAPYLHNNSVPTLYDLLLPASQRAVPLVVDRFDYDTRKLGMTIPPDADPALKFDVTRPGNSNAGHEFGTNLSEGERQALLEYLKRF
jgi:mono/diheme cytochrome c family protein